MLCCFLCCLKQRWSIWLLTANSVLLFLAGVFVIYVSICLYNGSTILGEESGDQSELSLDSYLVIFSMLMGCFALIVAFLGCCTARTRDKCSVFFFTTIAIAFSAIFLFSGSIMMVLHNNEEAFIDKFCSDD